MKTATDCGTITNKEEKIEMDTLGALEYCS